MPPRQIPGLQEFLLEFPSMAIRPSQGEATVIRGDFSFRATHPEFGTVTDSFELKIDISPDFPKSVPQAWELGGRIPRQAAYHINDTDGNVCLGSPIRLLLEIQAEPTLAGFAKRCLIPYFYSISRRLSGQTLAFGELPHRTPGLLADYLEIFGLTDHFQAGQMVKYLGMKKRLANKLPCPCKCKKKLGQCSYNFKVREFRHLANRSWYRRQHQSLLRELSQMSGPPAP